MPGEAAAELLRAFSSSTTDTAASCESVLKNAQQLQHLRLLSVRPRPPGRCAGIETF